jgi:hypothetical protein
MPVPRFPSLTLFRSRRWTTNSTVAVLAAGHSAGAGVQVSRVPSDIGRTGSPFASVVDRHDAPVIFRFCLCQSERPSYVPQAEPRAVADQQPAWDTCGNSTGAVRCPTSHRSRGRT